MSFNKNNFSIIKLFSKNGKNEIILDLGLRQTFVPKRRRYAEKKPIQINQCSNFELHNFERGRFILLFLSWLKNKVLYKSFDNKSISL